MDASTLKRLLVSGYIWAFSGRLITAISGLIVNALLARLLLPGDLGSYFLVVSLVSVISMIAMVGQQRAIVPVVSGAIAHDDIGKACRGIALSFSLVAGVSMSLALLLAWSGSAALNLLFEIQIMQSVLVVAAVLLVVRSMSSMFAETYRAFQDIGKAVFFNGVFVNVCFAIFLGGLLFIVGALTLHQVLIVSVVVYALNAVLAIALSRRWCAGVVTRSGIEIPELLKVGWPLMITGLTLFVITQADIWIIGAILDEQSVAVYGAAVRLVQMVAIPLMITNAVLPALVARLHAKGDLVLLEKMLRTAAMVAGVPAAIMLLIIIAYAPQILTLIYGQYYIEGANALVIISIGQLVNVAAGAGMIVLMVVGLQVYAMITSVISGVILIAGSILAANAYGIDGVAVAVSGTLALQAVAIVFIVRAKVGVWSHLGFGGVGVLMRHLGKAKDN